MSNKKEKVLVGLFILCFIVSLINIKRWYRWYKEKGIEIYIDVEYFLNNGISIKKISSIFGKLGINKLVVDLEHLLAQKIDLPHNKHQIIVKIYNTKFYNIEDLSKFVELNKEKIFSLIYIKTEKINHLAVSQTNLLGRRVAEEEILKQIEKHNFVKLNFENVKLPQVSNPDILPLRTFVCDLNLYFELNLQKGLSRSVERLLIKVRKAVFERSCSVVYIIPSTFFSFEENLKIISEICQNLNRSSIGFNRPLIKFISLNFKKLNNILVILLSTILPLYFFRKAANKILQYRSSVSKVFFQLNCLFLLTGINFWGLMVKYEYIALKEYIYGIKLMLILPVFVSFFIFFSKEEIKSFFNYQIKVKDVLFGLVFFLIILYLLLRSGNVEINVVPKYELKIRELIEAHILFRPRFKDVFFSQPLLVISLQLLYKYSNPLPVEKILFCISIFSFTFMINTFLHVHTPIWFCFLRSVLGIILGFGVGKILWWWYDRARKVFKLNT